MSLLLGGFMTRRLFQLYLCALVASGWFLISAPLAAQDSPQPETTKSSAAKSRKTAPPAKSGEASQDQDSAAKMTDADRAKPAEDDATKADEAKRDEAKKDEDGKKEDATPPPPSPKLIEVPQDDATYTPRPKVVAVFIFTDGNRIESDDYLITKDALFINKDGQKTRYPINTVDRAATKAANQGRGVDIVFPKSKSEFNLDF